MRTPLTSVSFVSVCNISERTFLLMSINGKDFSCIKRPNDITPLLDKKNKSLPVDCTESLAIHPTPSIVSSTARLLAGLSAPLKIIMFLLPKTIRKPLCSARLTTSSYPEGQTSVKLIAPLPPPCQSAPFKKSLQYIVYLLFTISQDHIRPKAARTSLPCGGTFCPEDCNKVKVVEPPTLSKGACPV